MLDLPSGNVTFLFTDIEGSTRLLQQLGDRYVIVLTECCYLLRSAFQRWNGREVDTQGDSFFVAFAHPGDAVSAAVMAQRLLYTHTWPEGVAVRVRMGIHTGEPSLIPQGYIGLDVHRAARIMGAGHGGQVLLSKATYDLSKNTLPADVKLRDAGEHLLKDLQHPVHLFQLVISGIPADFPPLRTLNSSTTSSSAVSKHTTGAVYAIAWSPDRRYIASGGHDPTVRVWKSTTTVNVALYRGHTTGVFYIAWSPDGKSIASASLDKTIHVWSALPAEGTPVERRLSIYSDHFGTICSMAWSPDGKYIASTSSGGPDTTVHVWEASTGRATLLYKGHAYWVRAVAWSPNGRLIASCSLEEVQVWDITTGHKVFTYHGHNGWVKAIKWSANRPLSSSEPDLRIASAGEDKTVQVWNLDKEHAPVVYRGHADWVGVVEWSPDGRRIASMSRDNIVQVWDAASGGNALTFHCHTGSVHALAWLPDGKHLAAVSGDGVVQLWRAA